MTMLPEITTAHVEAAMAAWGDEEGMSDARKGLAADPFRHCPNETFAFHYHVAHAESIRAIRELERMEIPRVGAGDQAGGAQGTRPAGNTLRWRDRILWASVGLAIGSWCTALALTISTVLA
jgi:hypothetical protein